MLPPPALQLPTLLRRYGNHEQLQKTLAFAQHAVLSRVDLSLSKLSPLGFVAERSREEELLLATGEEATEGERDAGGIGLWAWPPPTHSLAKYPETIPFPHD